jgi:hypothetical protein
VVALAMIMHNEFLNGCCSPSMKAPALSRHFPETLLPVRGERPSRSLWKPAVSDQGSLVIFWV